MLLVRELSSHTLPLFDDIRKSLAVGQPPKITAKAEGLQKLLDNIKRELLLLLTDPGRRAAGALSNFVTYSRRHKDKPFNFAALESAAPGGAGEELATQLPQNPST
jgi:phosphate:Na+ symporter